MKFEQISIILEEKKKKTAEEIEAEKKASEEEQKRVMREQDKKIFKYDPDAELPKEGTKEYKTYERGKKEYNTARTWNRYLNSKAEGRKESDEIDRMQYDKDLRKNNKENVTNALNGNDERSKDNIKKAITNFLHSNVSNAMEAKDADVDAFRASANGQAIPGGTKYKDRWKHIVLTSLANKGWQQSDAQNFLNKQTQEVLNGKAGTGAPLNTNNAKAYQQGGVVIVSRADYDRIRSLHNELPEARTNANQLVEVRFTRDKRLNETGGLVKPITKTSDFMIEVGGSKILVTFKEVRNYGGSQTNQVNDVIKTLEGLKSNAKASDENKAIAVIKGENIESVLKTDENGVTHVLTKAGKGSSEQYAATNVYYKPIVIQTRKGHISVPRVLTYSKWLAFLEVLKHKSA